MNMRSGVREPASRRMRPLILECSRNRIAAALRVCLIPFLLIASSVQALDPNKRLTQYIHTSWRIHDESAPSPMSAVTQTKDGFLWFLSPSGEIYRFDGVRFRLWPLPAEFGSIGQIMNILGDREGGLWIVGEYEIFHIKQGAVISHIRLEGVMETSNVMTEDADGSIWAVRGEGGVSDPLCHITERSVKCFGKADGIPVSPIDAILPDGKGGFWLGAQLTLVHWHAGISETYSIGQGSQRNVEGEGIVSLALGHDGSLWVGIIAAGPGEGLARFEEGKIKSFVTPEFDGSKVGVLAMQVDHGGNLWVGTSDGGIVRVHAGAVDHYTRTEGLSSNKVRALLEDREGIIWAATDNGIDKFTNPRVTIFSTAEGLGNDSADGVVASRDGTIWIANIGSLDHIAGRAISSIRTGKGLPGEQVTAILEDHSGNMWLGVGDGLYLFHNGRFVRLREPNHQPLGTVVGMTEDTDGNIWAQCANPRRVVRVRNVQVLEEFSPSQVPRGRITPDPRGGIWIGTRQGELALFRQGVLKRFPVNPKFDPIANQVVAQADGTVLAAYDDGLVVLHEGKVLRMTVKNGLPCDLVISLIQDKQNYWWLNTKCGIVGFRDSEFQRWLANPEVVIETRLLDRLDGARPVAQASTFTPPANSSDGRIWFATGVVQMVDPSALSHEAIPAQTYIDSVKVDRKEFHANDNLRLPPHPRELQVDYTSPTLLIPQRVRFRYRLDGYDREWHDAGTRRQAFYTDLPPRRYSFRVVACNSDGVCNDTPATLEFSVAPAYYQTNWFRIGCAALVLVLVWTAYRLRVQQLARQFDLALDARVAERTRIGRELHDTLLQSFHAILLKFQSVLNLLPERPAEARDKLERALDQATEAVTEARDAVQGLRPSALDTRDLADSIARISEELTIDQNNSSSAVIHVEVEGTARELKPMVRDEVYRIACEALRNAVRHAQAREIAVAIQYDEPRFRLRVRDDGSGISEEIVERQARVGHFGLPGMRERAEIIGGHVDIWSKLGSGTEVDLSIPANVAYCTPPRWSWLLQLFSKQGRDNGTNTHE